METNPTAMEIREPKSIRLRTSRPSWSVPSQCAWLGGKRICFTSYAPGSYGARTGARIATSPSRITTTPPATAS